MVLLKELKRINKTIDLMKEQVSRYRREINYITTVKPELKEYFSEKTLKESPYNLLDG